MTIHSSILAWRIPWTEEPGGLLSIVSHSQTQLKQVSTLILTQNSSSALKSSAQNAQIISFPPHLISAQRSHIYTM